MHPIWIEDQLREQIQAAVQGIERHDGVMTITKVMVPVRCVGPRQLHGWANVRAVHPTHSGMCDMQWTAVLQSIENNHATYEVSI